MLQQANEEKEKKSCYQIQAQKKLQKITYKNTFFNTQGISSFPPLRLAFCFASTSIQELVFLSFHFSKIL